MAKKIKEYFLKNIDIGIELELELSSRYDIIDAGITVEEYHNGFYEKILDVEGVRAEKDGSLSRNGVEFVFKYRKAEKLISDLDKFLSNLSRITGFKADHRCGAHLNFSKEQLKTGDLLKLRIAFEKTATKTQNNHYYRDYARNLLLYRGRYTEFNLTDYRIEWRSFNFKGLTEKNFKKYLNRFKKMLKTAEKIRVISNEEMFKRLTKSQVYLSYKASTREYDFCYKGLEAKDRYVMLQQVFDYRKIDERALRNSFSIIEDEEETLFEIFYLNAIRILRMHKKLEQVKERLLKDGENAFRMFIENAEIELKKIREELMRQQMLKNENAEEKAEKVLAILK